MKPWHKWTIGFVGALLVLALGLWFCAPIVVRWQVRKRHPEVSFAKLELHWRRITLFDVGIDKGWIKVTAKTARVELRNEAVHLVAGHVDVDLDRRPPHHDGSKPDQPNVTAEDFTVTVRKSGPDDRLLLASLRDVTVSPDRIVAGSGEGSYGRYRVRVARVDLPRDFSRVRLGSLEFPAGLPLPDLPLVFPVVTGLDIDVEKREVSARSCDFDFQLNRVAVTGLHAALDGDVAHLRVEALKAQHPWLAPPGESATFKDIALDIGVDWKKPFDVHLGDATVHVDPTAQSVSGDETCATWVKALPDELAPGPLRGQVEWKDRLRFSLGLLPKPHLSVSGKCTTTCTDPSITALKHRFSYVTYDADGNRSEHPRETGPDVDDWVPLSQVNPNMLEAVANTEDWGFWNHHGYVASALEQSFLEDVHSGKFQRGGSTITMQTAKNVYLSRDKTFGRKVSELFLSQVLESCLTKQEIIELYLNVVELGPNIYGLRQAADHYFHVEPMSLDPKESFYLACILPRPRHAPPPNAATMARMDSLMRVLAGKGRISDTMMLGVETPDTTGWAAP